MEITSGIINKPIRVVIYGAEGIGKSTFAAQFPNPLFIDTEGSTAQLDVKRLPEPTSWAMIKEELQYVDAHLDVCNTLVIDTLDWAERLCIRDFCAKENIDGIERMSYGKGYTYIAEEFGRFLNYLTTLQNKGLNIVLVAHAMMRKFEQPDEMGAYDRWELKLQKKVSPLVKEWADMILFANFKTMVIESDKKKKAVGGQRVMYTSHHPCWDAKNRFGLADELPFDYSQIAHLFKTQNKPNTAQNDSKVQTLADNANNAISQENHTYSSNEQNNPQYLKPLTDLMEQSRIEESDVVYAVAQKGYFPANMKLADYPQEFVNFLTANWEPIKQEILNRTYGGNN